MVMSEVESGFGETASQLKSTHGLVSCSTFPDDTKESPVEAISLAPQGAVTNLATRANKRSCTDSGTVVTIGSISKEVSTSDTGYLHEHVPEIKDHFDVVSKIGEGTFSSVYLATVSGHPKIKVALKHIIPTSSTTRIENEIRCLKMMGGKDNVITINGCIRCRDHTVLILPYFSHDKFTDYLMDITIEETRLYLQALFLALSNVHKHNIIHRDVKPSNFLYNRISRRFQLIDFGLAHFDSTHNKKSESKCRKESKGVIDTYQKQAGRRWPTKRSRTADGQVSSKPHRIESLCPTRHYNDEVCGFCLGRNSQVAARAGTPGFRAPEVLLKCSHQTTAVDIWSAGVILLCILSRRYPFFRAHDDQSALAQIVSLMGSNECNKAATACGKEILCHPDVPPADLKVLCQQLRASVPLPDMSPTKKCHLNDGTALSTDMNRSQANSENIPDSLFDLLHQCLDLNPKTRVTAILALKHPFIAVDK